MSVGLIGYLGIGIQSAGAGLTSGHGSAAIVDFIPFISENLAVTREDLPDPSLWTNFDERRMYNGQQKVEGGVQTVMHPLLSGYLLRLAFDACTAQQGANTAGAWPAASHATIREHHFVTGQTQFQAGSGSDAPLATIEVNRGPVLGTGSSFVYYDVTGNAAEISVEAGNFARLSMELVGRDYGGKPRGTPSYVPPEAWLWSQISVSLNGTGNGLFQNFTVRLDNSIQGVPKLDGRLRPDLLKRQDFRRVSVNGTIVFQDFTDYDRFINGSEAQLLMFFTGKNITTLAAGAAGYNTENLEVDCPRFRYSTFPLQVGGPGLVTVGFTGRAMIDPTSLYSLECTIVNTRTSPYTVNTTA